MVDFPACYVSFYQAGYKDPYEKQPGLFSDLGPWMVVFLEDPGVDGLNIRSFEPYSDAAMQETTRTFFKEPGGNPGGWVVVNVRTVKGGQNG